MKKLLLCSSVLSALLVGCGSDNGSDHNNTVTKVDNNIVHKMDNKTDTQEKITKQQSQSKADAANKLGNDIVQKIDENADMLKKIAEQQTQSRMDAEPEDELSPTTQQSSSDSFVFAGTKGKLAFHNYLSSSEKPKRYVANFAICNDSACRNEGKGLKTGQIEFEIVPTEDGGLSIKDLKISQAQSSNVQLNTTNIPSNAVTTSALETDVQSGTITMLDEDRRIFGLNILDNKQNVTLLNLKIAFSEHGAYFTSISDGVSMAGARIDNPQRFKDTNVAYNWQNAKKVITGVSYNAKENWLANAGKFDFNTTENISEKVRGFKQTQAQSSMYGAYVNAGSSAFVYGYANAKTEPASNSNFVTRIAGVAVTDPTASFSVAINPVDSKNTVFQQ